VPLLDFVEKPAAENMPAIKVAALPSSRPARRTLFAGSIS
jgi:hypothetical protein